MTKRNLEFHEEHCANCFKPKACQYYFFHHEPTKLDLHEDFCSISSNSALKTKGCCPIIKCRYFPLCQFEFHHCKSVEHYFTTCQQTIVPCLNAGYGCPATLARRDIPKHLISCPASVVHCSFRWVRKLLPQYTTVYRVSTSSVVSASTTGLRQILHTSPGHLAADRFTTDDSSPSSTATTTSSMNLHAEEDELFSSIPAISCTYCKKPCLPHFPAPKNAGKVLNFDIKKQQSEKFTQIPAIDREDSSSVGGFNKVICENANSTIFQPLKIVSRRRPFNNNNHNSLTYDILNLDAAFMLRDQNSYLSKHPNFKLKLLDWFNNYNNNCQRSNVIKNAYLEKNNTADSSSSINNLHHRSLSFYDFLMLRRAEEASKNVLTHHHNELLLSTLPRGRSLKNTVTQSDTTNTTPNNHNLNNSYGSKKQHERPKSFPGNVSEITLINEDSAVTSSSCSSNASSYTIPPPSNTETFNTSLLHPPRRSLLLPVRILDKILNCRTFFSSTRYPGYSPKRLLKSADRKSTTVVPSSQNFNLAGEFPKRAITGVHDDEIHKHESPNVKEEVVAKLPPLNFENSSPTITFPSHPSSSSLIHESCSMPFGDAISFSNDNSAALNDAIAIPTHPFQFYDKRLHSFARYYFDPESVHYFNCGQFIRRDRFAWHYLNVHAEIENHLDDWLIHRCPLSAAYSTSLNSKCNFAVPRWIPCSSAADRESTNFTSNHNNLISKPTTGSIIYDTSLRSVVYKPDDDSNKIIHSCRHTELLTESSILPSKTEDVVEKRMVVNLNDIPPEALNRITNYLEPIDLINLSRVNKNFNGFVRSCPPLLKSKGMVICVWGKKTNSNILPGNKCSVFKSKTHWEITELKWVFPKSFTPIRDWKMNATNTSGIIAEHLKRCPLNEINIKKEPFQLPSLDPNYLSQRPSMV